MSQSDCKNACGRAFAYCRAYRVREHVQSREILSSRLPSALDDEFGNEFDPALT
jgi:hypothetical protein